MFVPQFFFKIVFWVWWKEFFYRFAIPKLPLFGLLCVWVCGDSSFAWSICLTNIFFWKPGNVHFYNSFFCHEDATDHICFKYISRRRDKIYWIAPSNFFSSISTIVRKHSLWRTKVWHCSGGQLGRGGQYLLVSDLKTEFVFAQLTPVCVSMLSMFVSTGCHTYIQKNVFERKNVKICCPHTLALLTFSRSPNYKQWRFLIKPFMSYWNTNLSLLQRLQKESPMVDSHCCCGLLLPYFRWLTIAMTESNCIFTFMEFNFIAHITLAFVTDCNVTKWSLRFPSLFLSINLPSQTFICPLLYVGRRGQAGYGPNTIKGRKSISCNLKSSKSQNNSQNFRKLEESHHCREF